MVATYFLISEPLQQNDEDAWSEEEHTAQENTKRQHVIR